MKHVYFLKVPLGIQLKNEANLKDIADILDSLNDYVPVQSSSGINEMLIPWIVFGDQMTVAQMPFCVFLILLAKPVCWCSFRLSCETLSCDGMYTLLTISIMCTIHIVGYDR